MHGACLNFHQYEARRLTVKRDLVDSAKRRRVIAGQRQRGVTLIELMVALTIFALLLGLALPSFRNVIASNLLSGTAQ